MNLRAADAAVAWGIMVLGTIHALATPYFVLDLGKPALWFASAGGAFILIGLLNLLRVNHAQAVGHLRSISRGANLVALGFVAVLAAVAPVGLGEWSALWLVGLATGFSMLRRDGM